MESIGLFEAKTHLSELIARAERGEEVIITRHNKPVAKIVPISPQPASDPAQRQAMLARMAALRADLARTGGSISRDDIVRSIRDMRDEQTERKMRAAGLK